MRLPKLFFDSDNEGKAIGINMFIGKRPYASIGNSNGDREMLEWTGAGDGARLKMLVLSRRRGTGICLWTGGRTARYQGRYLPPVAHGGGEDAVLDGYQHEERLEAHLCV